MISTAEKKWVWWFALGVVVFTTIPYALGFSLQGDEWRFSGFVFGVEDGNSYIAKMLSGSEGEWLFRTPFTAFEQKGMLAFLPYILLGKLASPPGRHDQLVALFHLFRWAAIFLYAFAAYEFISIFLKQINHRRAALVLAFFGGGLGFLTVFGVKASGWGGLPLEFYSPESFGFLAVFGLPHITAGRAFLLWGLAQILGDHKSKSIYRVSVYVGLIWTLLGLMQPLTVVVGWVVLGGGLAAEWLINLYCCKKDPGQAGEREELVRKTRMGLLSIGFSAPIPLYTFLAFQLDPFLRSWSAQNLILSPPLLDYLLAYGLILPFALAGAVRALRNRLPGSAFLAGWLALLPILAYAPYNLQRRLPEGVWVCLVVLGLLAVELHSPRSIWRRLQPVIYIGLLSTLFFYVGGLEMVASLGEPLYVRTAEVKVYERLEMEAGDRFLVVLADYPRSNALPAWSAARVIIGHGPESVDLAAIQPQVEAFLRGVLDEDKALDLVTSQQVDFVLASPDDLVNLSNRYPFLIEIYTDEGYRVYKVVISS